MAAKATPRAGAGIVYLLGMILLVMSIGGCAAKSKHQAAGSEGMSLDAAIKEAAAKIDERVEAGTKIALLNFNSPSQRFSLYVLDELTANLLDSRKLTVVDRKELDLIRGEFEFQLSGDVEDSSVQELGRMLGAQSIVSGSLTEIGGSYRIVIRVLSVQSAAIVAQYRTDIANDKRVAALLERRGGGRTASAPPHKPRPRETTTSTTSSGSGTTTTTSAGGVNTTTTTVIVQPAPPPPSQRRYVSPAPSPAPVAAASAPAPTVTASASAPPQVVFVPVPTPTPVVVVPAPTPTPVVASTPVAAAPAPTPTPAPAATYTPTPTKQVEHPEQRRKAHGVFAPPFAPVATQPPPQSVPPPAPVATPTPTQPTQTPAPAATPAPTPAKPVEYPEQRRNARGVFAPPSSTPAAKSTPPQSVPPPAQVATPAPTAPTPATATEPASASSPTTIKKVLNAQRNAAATAAASAASISFTTLPAKADIYVDGKLAGTSNTGEFQVKAGTHQVRFVKGDIDKTFTFTFNPGKNETKFVPLK